MLAFGMAEAKRRAYGEDGIYFDHRRDRDGAYRKTCNGRWPFPGADRQQAEAAACGPGYRARRFGFTSLNGTRLRHAELNAFRLRGEARCLCGDTPL